MVAADLVDKGEPKRHRRQSTAVDMTDASTAQIYRQHINTNQITTYDDYITVHRLTKCGLVSFADLRQRSLAMKGNAEFTEGG